MKLFNLKQKGDTIVEVLISIAALSLVLSASYALANRSTQGVRQSQERGEALKLAQSQIESLKQYFTTASPANSVPDEDQIFCMKSDGAIELFTSSPPGTAQEEMEVSNPFSNYPSACKTGEYYNSFIKREGDTFTAHTRWFNVTGSGIDEATMAHKIYPDRVALGGGGLTDPGCPPNHISNFGTCIPCPPNHESPGGDSLTCSPVPPTVKVVVKKIMPNSDDTTPSCSSLALQDMGGARVNLTGGGESFQQQTGGDSTATFSRLKFSTSYNATFTAPSGTNRGSTTPSWEACPPSSASATTPPSTVAGSVQVATPILKFRPICYSESYTVAVTKTGIRPVYGWVYNTTWYNYTFWSNKSPHQVDAEYPDYTSPYWGRGNLRTIYESSGNRYIAYFIYANGAYYYNDWTDRYIWGIVGTETYTYTDYETRYRNECP